MKRVTKRALAVFRRVFPDTCRIEYHTPLQGEPVLRIVWHTRNPNGKRVGLVSCLLAKGQTWESLAESMLAEYFLPQIADRKRIWRFQKKMARALGIPEACMPLGCRFGLFDWRDALASCVKQVWRVIEVFRPDLREIEKWGGV